MAWEEHRRRKRARQMMKRLEELDRIDSAYGVGAMPTVPPRRRSRMRTGLVMVACAGVFAAIIASAALRDPRNGMAPGVSDGDGEFAFSQLQDDGRTPVGYNPCSTIKIEVNTDNAPPVWRDLVETAMAHVSEPSGLRFELVGTTSSRRYLDQRQLSAALPAIVGWASARELPSLGGDVAGQAGSTSFGIAGFRKYVSGVVVLDSEAFDQMLRAGRDDAAQAIVDHEFGHLVGLGHVKDRGELMYAENVGQTTWGPGDREGLARLGNLRCR